MTTYYVSPSGSDTANGTSTSTPFATIQHAIDQTAAGDHVQVMAGTYSVDQATGYVVATGRSGTAGAPITLENYPGSRPVISLPNGGVSAIQINGSYWVIQGFELIGNSQSIQLADAQQRAAASTPGQPQDRTIIASGITVGYNGPLFHHVTISNCVIHDFPGAGVSGQGTDYITVQQCNVYQCAFYSPYGCSGITLYGSTNFDSGTGYRNYIVANRVWGNAQKVGSYAFAGSTGAVTDGEGINFDTAASGYTGRTLCANNITFNNGSCGILCHKYNAVDSVFNTCYQDDTQNMGGTVNLTQSTGCTVANNIVVAATNRSGITHDATTGNTIDYNVVFGGNAATNGAHDVLADPKLSHPGQGFFIPLSGSPARGFSNGSAYGLTTDYNGRPRSGAFDAGAIQQQTVTPVVLGSGPQAIILNMAEDAYQGNATFTIAVDGVQLGGTQTVTALDAGNESQAYTLQGTWASGPHTVTLTALNYFSAGPGINRALRIASITANSTTATINGIITTSQAYTVRFPGTGQTPATMYFVRDNQGRTILLNGKKWAVASPGQFYVNNGKIIAPNGAQFVARGVNVTPYTNYTPSGYAAVKSLFPGINFIRVVTASGWTASGQDQATVTAFIAAATADGVVCMIDNHSIATVNTGSALTAVCNWYAGLATTYKNNPYVWFNTSNEPDGAYSSIAAEELAIYNAIRTAGNNTIILMSLRGGGYTEWLSGQGSTWASMTNVGWDIHFYGYLTLNYGSGTSYDTATTAQALTNEIAAAQAYHSADGIMPCVIGEFGPSTSGAANSTDANATQVLSAVLSSGYGFAAWAFNGTGSPGGDSLQVNNVLTTYGQQIATAIAGSH